MKVSENVRKRRQWILRLSKFHAFPYVFQCLFFSILIIKRIKFININLIWFFCFRDLIIPTGLRCHKLSHIIFKGITHCGTIDELLSKMIIAYYTNDETNIYLNAGVSICHGKRTFIYECMRVQKHFRKVNFFEILRKLIYVDPSAAILIVENVI